MGGAGVEAGAAHICSHVSEHLEEEPRAPTYSSSSCEVKPAAMTSYWRNAGIRCVVRNFVKCFVPL